MHFPNGDIVVIGGFGISELSTVHRRLNDVLLFRKYSDHYECNILPMCGDVPGVLLRLSNMFNFNVTFQLV